MHQIVDHFKLPLHSTVINDPILCLEVNQVRINQ